jgi:hypothetical protein
MSETVQRKNKIGKYSERRIIHREPNRMAIDFNGWKKTSRRLFLRSSFLLRLICTCTVTKCIKNSIYTAISMIAAVKRSNCPSEEKDGNIKKYWDRLMNMITKGIPARFDFQNAFFNSLKNRRIRLSDPLNNFPLMHANKATVAGIMVIIGRQATIQRNWRITMLVNSSNIL